MTENKLVNLRQEIDKIDEKIIKLFAERFEVVKQIGILKKVNGVEIVDKNRWKKVLEKVEHLAEKQGISEDCISTVYNIIHEYSCKTEEDLCLKVGHQGIKGAFSYIATKKISPNQEIVSFETFEQLFQALQDGKINFAVIPIENSHTGEIRETSDLMKKYKFKIVKKIKLPIRHNLAGLQNVKLSDITDIFSHEQALKQCEKKIKKILPQAKLIDMKNTAISAQYVKLQKNKHYACICSQEAITEYKLCCLKRNMQDDKNNATTFCVIIRNNAS